MNRAFVLAVCRSCPHVRLVGGEPPDWRVQVCLHAVDHADRHQRAKTDAHDLRTLDACPDPVRAARGEGAI